MGKLILKSQYEGEDDLYSVSRHIRRQARVAKNQGQLHHSAFSGCALVGFRRRRRRINGASGGAAALSAASAAREVGLIAPGEKD
jgi:hypothetical protein